MQAGVSRKHVFLYGMITARLVLAVAFMLLAPWPAPASLKYQQWLATGENAARHDSYDTALLAYDHLLSRTGAQPVVYERLLQLCLDAGNYDHALTFIYALGALDGWHQARRETLITILDRLGEKNHSETLVRADLSQGAYGPEALRALARDQLAHQDWSGAARTLGRLMVFLPEDSEALYLLGIMMVPDDLDRAIDYLTQAAADPVWAFQAQTVLTALGRYETDSPAEAHTFLGVTLVGLGEWTLAERVLELALDANAVNPAALAYLGFARDQQGREGLPDLEAALAMAPRDPLVYYLLGQHWLLAEDYQAAYENFIQAYWLDTGNPALAVEVGTTLQHLGDLAGAEEWLRIAVDAEPTDTRWYVLLAVFYADTGYELKEGGLAFIEEASQLVPDDPDVFASLGWGYFQTQQFDRAYEALSRAIGLDPTRTRSRYYWGMILERKGDRQGAIDTYQYVVDREGPDTGFGMLAARALQHLGTPSG